MSSFELAASFAWWRLHRHWRLQRRCVVRRDGFLRRDGGKRVSSLRRAAVPSKGGDLAWELLPAAVSSQKANLAQRRKAAKKARRNRTQSWP